MAIQALPGDIGDIFLGMMLLGLCLIVTFIAVHRGVRPAVATGALTASVPMIHGEGMPGYIDAGPAICVMALRTLSRPVVGRPVMTGLAVGGTLMAECRTTPTTGVMAIRALAAVVVSRLVTTMAGLAIRLAGMVELGILPTAGVVATGTLAAVVVGRFVAAVARLAIR